MSLEDKNKETLLRWSRGDLERVESCPACGSAARTGKELTCADHRTPLRDERWSLHRCTDCRSLYLDPRPDMASLPKAYEVYYTHNEESEQVPDSGLDRILWSLIHGYLNHRFGMTRTPTCSWGRWSFGLMVPWRMKLDYYGRHLFLNQFPRRGRLLDVGCGNGAFLARAREMGWEVFGLEPDPKAVAACRNQCLEVVQGQLGDCPRQWTAYFDVVTMSHSIEHVADPGMALRLTHGLLKPKGMLWLACPNPNSLGSRFYAGAWRELHPPYHLVIPSQMQLRKLLTAAGFAGVQPLRRGIHARRMILESAENARYAGGWSMHVRASLAWFIRVMADAVATFTPRGSEETVLVAHRPEKP